MTSARRVDHCQPTLSAPRRTGRRGQQLVERPGPNAEQPLEGRSLGGEAAIVLLGREDEQEARDSTWAPTSISSSLPGGPLVGAELAVDLANVDEASPSPPADLHLVAVIQPARASRRVT